MRKILYVIIKRNVERDRKNKEKLIAMGWKVITIWECELKKKVAEERLNQLCEEITAEQK